MNRLNGIARIVAYKIARDSSLWSSGDLHRLPSEKDENFHLGGEIASVQIIDATKAHIPTPAHRAIRHHSLGISDAEALFGVTITNSAGRVIPTRWIGEQHLREDCGCIPTVADWLKDLPIASWMVRSQILGDEGSIDLTHAAWRAVVARQQTELGYRDWYAQLSSA